MKLYVLVDETRGVAIMTLAIKAQAQRMLSEESTFRRPLRLFEIEAKEVEPS